MPPYASQKRDDARGPARGSIAWLLFGVGMALSGWHLRSLSRRLTRASEGAPLSAPVRRALNWSNVVFAVAPSCARPLRCGAEGASCCDERLVPEGDVLMGRARSGGDAFAVPNPEELPERRVHVPAFSLDRFEVTVGRFRAFVEAWDGRAIPEGAGAHPGIPGSGWRSEWNQHLPLDRNAFAEQLHCGGGEEHWDRAEAHNDGYPMGCLTWYEAFAFCVWDGGRLPTEAEWERAAAAGEENRIYPWGNAPPSCLVVSPLDECHGQDVNPSRVGMHPLGAGRWGHEDLAGSVEEWVLDYFGPYASVPGSGARVNPLGPTFTGTLPAQRRVLRGLGLFGGGGDMRAADRGNAPPAARYVRYGVRCARDRPRS